MTAWRVSILGPTRLEQSSASTLAEDCSLVGVRNRLRDPLSTQLDHPVGAIAVDPGLGQEFDGRPKRNAQLAPAAH